MRMLVSLSLLLALFPPTGPSDIYADDQAFSAVARSIMDEYRSACLAGDAERFLSLWDSNAVEMPQAQGMILGKDNLATRWRLSFRVSTYEMFEIEITDAYVDKNLGVVYGNLRWRIRLKGGARESRNGKYVTILRQQPDGTWKILLDCSNTNN